jgi:hypothetical protein
VETPLSNSQVANVTPVVERRRSPRFPCNLQLAIEWGSTLIEGAVRQISAEGMFVEVSGPLWVGARFAAQLTTDEAVAVDCVVRRVEPRRGMGLTYAPSQTTGRAVIASLIKRLAD